MGDHVSGLSQKFQILTVIEFNNIYLLYTNLESHNLVGPLLWYISWYLGGSTFLEVLVNIMLYMVRKTS